MLEPKELEKIDEVTKALSAIARAISPSFSFGGPPSIDATGNVSTSLMETVKGVSSGLVLVAAALNNIAEAIKEKSEDQH